MSTSKKQGGLNTECSANPKLTWAAGATRTALKMSLKASLPLLSFLPACDDMDWVSIVRNCAMPVSNASGVLESDELRTKA